MVLDMFTYLCIRENGRFHFTDELNKFSKTGISAFRCRIGQIPRVIKESPQETQKVRKSSLGQAGPQAHSPGIPWSRQR